MTRTGPPEQPHRWDSRFEKEKRVAENAILDAERLQLKAERKNLGKGRHDLELRQRELTFAAKKAEILEQRRIERDALRLVLAEEKRTKIEVRAELLKTPKRVPQARESKPKLPKPPVEPKLKKPKAQAQHRPQRRKVTTPNPTKEELQLIEAGVLYRSPADREADRKANELADFHKANPVVEITGEVKVTTLPYLGQAPRNTRHSIPKPTQTENSHSDSPTNYTYR